MASSRPPPLPRTVILDYYDSYTNNLLTLFTQLYSDEEVLKKVVVIKADRYQWNEFKDEVLPGIDCIILSPGPGRPDNPADIGFGLELLRLHPVPILGVCLGHQAIGVAFGGKIINTPRITHGHVVPIAPVKPAKGLFASKVWEAAGIQEKFDVVVYNSLIVDQRHLPDELEVTAWSVPPKGEHPTIQGLKHRKYPIWGVQYHPESISSTHGRVLLQAFLNEVHVSHSLPPSYPPLAEHVLSSCAYRVAARGLRKIGQASRSASPFPTPPISRSASQASIPESSKAASLRLVEHSFGDHGRDLATEVVFEHLIRSRKGKERAIGDVWLDGKSPSRRTTTALAAPSFAITYTLSSRTVRLHQPAAEPERLALPEGMTFWDWFSEGHDAISASLSRRLDSKRKGWQGGWVGWFGYEMKEESLQGYQRRPRTPDEGVEEVDACWAWCDHILERTQDGEFVARAVLRDETLAEDLVNEHESTIGGIPSLIEWIESRRIPIGGSATSFDTFVRDIGHVFAPADPAVSVPAASFPSFRPLDSRQQYSDTISACREAIRQGESYELTLTTQFRSHIPPEDDPFSLYLRLRTFNPAYYSAFLSFPSISTPRGAGIHVLSSSPERFLKIERGQVEMMPIKGTRARVKPGQCVCTPNTGCRGLNVGSPACVAAGEAEDRRRAEELQADKKERAENLMIVDLIRSDLLGCCVPSTVQVPKLIAVETYGVHNLVTTVQGNLASNVGQIEAVKRCFPPGSMTGAPKLRSVQLLDDFEHHQRRGIYSGALGYISVDGATDLSVVIRTIVIEGSSLSIGAGGAITWLSENQMEWDEVLTKVKSVVGPLDLGE